MTDKPKVWRSAARRAAGMLWAILLLLLLPLGCGGSDRPKTEAPLDSVAADTGTEPLRPSAPPSAQQPDTQLARAGDTAPARAPARARDTVPPSSSESTAVQRPSPPPPSATTPPAKADSAPPSAPSDPYHQPPRDTVSVVEYNGWKQYNLNCARCHGEDVLGTTIAPHLVTSLKPDGPINTKELFLQTVCEGRPAKGMPAWCTLGMEPATIEAIYLYVKGRSEGRIHPGRPARQGG